MEPSHRTNHTLTPTMAPQSTHANRPSAKYAFPMTPEEPLAHSFSSQNNNSSNNNNNNDKTDDKQHRLPPISVLVSPPTSPAFDSLPSIASATGYAASSPEFSRRTESVTRYESTPPTHRRSSSFGDAAAAAYRDAPLFPLEPDRPQQHSPLFRSSERTAASPLPERPRVARSPETVGFTLDFPFNLGIRTSQQAHQYWTDRVDEEKRRRSHYYTLPAPLNTASSTRRDALSIRQLQNLERSNAAARAQRQTTRVQKPKPAAAAAAAAAASSRRETPPSHRAPKRTKTQRDFAADPSPARADVSEKATKHKRAPASKPRPVGESWLDVPDYCPPADSARKPLRARAVGSSGPLDLSSDPDRHHLHPDELQVAAVLRLQCAKYLLNKRKIFASKVEHLRAVPQANFNKTEAQKACTIDVNKASSLFAAFDEAGWFDGKWFERFL